MPNEFCEISIDNGCIKGKKLKRNNYFSGKKMGVDDFNAEQGYLIEKIRNLSANINGSGVIEGLKIDSIGSGKITLNAGAAIDVCGNLLLTKKRVFELEKSIKAGDHIYLAYSENGTDKVPVKHALDCSDDCCYDRIEEDVKIVVYDTLKTPSPMVVCDGLKGKNRGAKVLPEEPLVLLGVYRSNGGIDYSDVVYIHKNSELSKRLCEISERYVSSVNGATGDVSAVSSLNDAEPDGNGHIEIEGGNNISVESSGNSVTISAKSGFYDQQYITLNKGAGTFIEHNCRRYPVVDVYRRVAVAGHKHEAVSAVEIYKMARDTMRSVEEMIKEMDAMPFMDYTKEYNRRNTSKKKTLSEKSKISSNDALSKFEIMERSSKVNKMSDMSISRAKDDIYVRPRYSYQKVVGSADPGMNVTVSHSSYNSVHIKNNGTSKVSLLIILST